MKSLSDLTSQCIRCGFCLEACPTYVMTGSEIESPRGRIYLARSADEGVIEWADAQRAFDTCLGCRACEPACPSGVEYGHILELARQKLDQSKGLKKLLDGLSDPAAFRRQVGLAKLWPGTKVPGFVSRQVTDEKPQARLPRVNQPQKWPKINEAEMPELQGEVYLLEGCAMRVLYPGVHEATRRLLRRVGFSVRETDAGCCGALHAHSGFLEDAQGRAKDLVAAMPDGLPVIVNSAGCGSAMKGYGALIGELGEKFAEGVYDATEFLEQHGLADKLTSSPGIEAKATYHDACHLAHGQLIKAAPRALIQAIPGIQFVELPDSDTCCGSAGVYNLTQPTYARQLLDNKWEAVTETKAQIVATGNPGCQAWIEQASDERGGEVKVLHTLELLEASFSGLRSN
ncbi:MAG: (Fe-S)-binding protein [Armatimonadetes bacterium]|nr:(Fe-S)-binding protein [Armatimonadota bacterium]